MNSPAVKLAQNEVESSQEPIKKRPAHTPFLKKLCANRLGVGKFNIGCSIGADMKYAYIEVPKAASTSILNVLQHHADAEMASRMTHEHYAEQSPLKQLSDFDEETQKQILTGPEVTRFTFVRHPYTRTLSAYLSKVHGNSAAKRQLLSYIHAIPVAEVDQSEEISFPQFVDVICNQSFSDMNSHWLIQTHQCLYDRVEYDFVGRFENLVIDFNTISRLIYPEERLQLKLSSKRNTGSDGLLDEYFTEDLKDRIYQKFYDDFQAFDYQKSVVPCAVPPL